MPSIYIPRRGSETESVLRYLATREGWVQLDEIEAECGGTVYTVYHLLDHPRRRGAVEKRKVRGIRQVQYRITEAGREALRELDEPRPAPAARPAFVIPKINSVFSMGAA